MKKRIITLLLFCSLAIAGIAQDKAGSGAPPTKSKTGSTAIWIGLGVVMLVLVVAANKRKKNNDRP